MYYIGIDLGGTNIAGGVVDDKGKIIVKSSRPTLFENGPQQIKEGMHALALELTAQAGLTPRAAAVQHSVQIIKPFVGKARVHSIKHSDFFVENYIRIIRHSVWNFVLSFKQIDLVVVDADITDVIGNCHISGTPLL